VRDALRLRHTLVAIYKTIRGECGLAALDENLWAFWGFYHAPDDRHYQARQWRKVRLSTIEPRQVTDLPVREMAFMLRVAMELEDRSSAGKPRSGIPPRPIWSCRCTRRVSSTS
jgi:hypothetical protein